MGFRSKAFRAGACLAGGLLLAQAPEFSQQYHQRIGGAVEELRTVVEDFDQDAEKVGLDRQAALSALANSDTSLVQLRSDSMARTIARFETLQRQRQKFQSVDPLGLPVLLVFEADEKLLIGTWQVFKPGLPLTKAGMLYALVGALLGFGLARAIIALNNRQRRAQNDKKLQQAIFEGGSVKRG